MKPRPHAGPMNAACSACLLHVRIGGAGQQELMPTTAGDVLGLPADRTIKDTLEAAITVDDVNPIGRTFVMTEENVAITAAYSGAAVLAAPVDLDTTVIFGTPS